MLLFQENFGPDRFALRVAISFENRTLFPGIYRILVVTCARCCVIVFRGHGIFGFDKDMAA